MSRYPMPPTVGRLKVLRVIGYGSRQPAKHHVDMERRLIEGVRRHADPSSCNRRQRHANARAFRVNDRNRLTTLLFEILVAADAEGEQVPDLQQDVVGCDLERIEIGRGTFLFPMDFSNVHFDFQAKLADGIIRLPHQPVARCPCSGPVLADQQCRITIAFAKPSVSPLVFAKLGFSRNVEEVDCPPGVRVEGRKGLFSQPQKFSPRTSMRDHRRPATTRVLSLYGALCCQVPIFSTDIFSNQSLL
jgi:hypothetical protein